MDSSCSDEIVLLLIIRSTIPDSLNYRTGTSDRRKINQHQKIWGKLANHTPGLSASDPPLLGLLLEDADLFFLCDVLVRTA